MKDLAEIIKYAEQYKANKSYNVAYKKSKKEHRLEEIIYGKNWYAEI